MQFLSLGGLRPPSDATGVDESDAREGNQSAASEAQPMSEIQSNGSAKGLSNLAEQVSGGATESKASTQDLRAGAVSCLTEQTSANGSSNGTQSASKQTSSDGEADEHLTLPPQVEELREKLSQGTFQPWFRGVTKPGSNRPSNQEPPSMRAVNADGIPTFGTFKFGYLPTRGLIYSTIGHEIALFALFLMIHFGLLSFRAQKLLVGIEHNQSHIVYLPEVGGGAQGQKSPGGGQSTPQEASAAPARASKGFAYPGAQAILSDPPNPTNAFQTVLRPLIVHPEPLKKLVPLPNIVQMAETRLPNDLIAPKPAMPQFHPGQRPIKVKHDSNAHREAKWKVPVSDAPQLVAKAEMPKLPAAEEPLPEAPKIQPKQEEEKREVEKPSPNPIKVTAEKRAEKPEKQAAPLSPAQVARLEMHGKAAEPLLSLSPMPVAPGSAKVPAGEARGRFAIAPGGTLNPNSTTPGKTNGAPSISPATGSERSDSANAATELAANTGTGAGHNSAAGGGSGNALAASGGGSAGAGTGSGNTSGTGVGGTGTGKGGHGGAGKGAGTSGRGAGTGSGAGSGAGTGAFPGISIQGGEGNEAKNNPPSFTVAPQTAYGMTVVATASSGGGLPDYGVFRDERVFTVYIAMKRTPEDEDPTWTLQYAAEDSSVTATGDQQVAAPSPVMREWPEIPADLEKKYAQRQVVIYALVDKEGKVSHISVRQTPDERVSDLIVQALAKWIFRPAQLNSQPIAVKILVGIPL